MQHISPLDAQAFLAEHPEALFIDCRSEMEFMFVGHPKGAIHVPWNDGPDWEVNPHFVGQVKKMASSDRPVVVICRSGNRSIYAGEALEQGGFSKVINVLYGFEGDLNDSHQRSTLNGWRFDGLPWEQI